MKNKKFIATAVSAALVASVVAPVVADAATGSTTKKSNIKDVRLKSATVAKVYYTGANGKTISKDITLSTPVKHLSTYAIVPLNGQNFRYNFNERVQLPQQKSYAKYIALAKQAVTNGDAEAAEKALATASAHLANMNAAHYSASTLENYKTNVETVKQQVEGLKVPTVSSVTAITAPNLKQVKVEFNTEVNIDDATFTVDGTSYTTKTPSADSVKLSDDKKSATITLTTAKAQGDTAPVVVDNVVAVKDGAKLVQYSLSIKFEDKEAPTIKEIKSVTKDTIAEKITVEFSEPVQGVGVVKIGDDYATATLEPDGTYSIRFSDASKKLEVGKSYSLTINNVVDFAGNATAELKSTVTVTRDEVKPTYTIKPINATTFDIEFDKEMSDSIQFDAVTVKDAKDNSLTLANLPEKQTDKKTFRVTLATNPIEDGKTSAVVSVKVAKFMDKVGNEVTAKTENVTLSQDLVKPEMVSAKISATNKNVIEVTFSEKVTDVQGADFVLSNDATPTAAGINPTTVKDAVAGAVTTVSNKDNKVFLDFGTLANGNYTLALMVNSVQDTSGNKNLGKAIKITQSSQAITPLNAKIVNKYNSTYTNINQTDNTGTETTLSNDLGSGTASDRKLVITFDSADVITGTDALTGSYKVGAADNPENYTVAGKALPEGAKVTFKNNLVYKFNGMDNVLIDAVEIDLSAVKEALLPDALKDGGDVQVNVNNVKTTSGATVYTSAQVAVKDTTAPKMTSAYLTASAVDSTNNYTLIVNFSEKVTGSIDATKFQISGLKTDGSTATSVLGTGTVVGAGTTTLKIEVAKVGFGTSGNLIDLTKGSLKVKALTGHNVTDMATTPVSLVDDSEIAITNWVK